jgi:ribosomal protein S6
MDSKENNVYEIGYLILPSLTEDKVDGVVEAIKSLVAQHEGKEIDGEAPFKQDLAYTMSKTVGASRYVVNEAYIGWLKFELEPSKALDLKLALDKLPEVLRMLLVKVPRETTFTFAKARAKAIEKTEAENPKEGPVAEGSPSVAEEAPSRTADEATRASSEVVVE